MTSFLNLIMAAAGSGSGPVVENKRLIVGTSSSANLVPYQKVDDAFVRYASPTPIPTGAVNAQQFSPNGLFYLVGTGNSPYIAAYIVSGSGGTLTKITNPATIPSGVVNTVGVNADGTFCIVGMATTPYLRAYRRATPDATSFTNLTITGTLPAASVPTLSVSPDGKWLTAGSGTALFTFSITGTFTTTRIADADVMPTGIVQAVAYNAASDRLYVAHNTSPFISAYSVNTTTGVLTKLANPSSLPRGNGLAVAVSPDGVYVIVASNNATATSRLNLYKRSGDVLTLLTDVVTGPAGAVNAMSFDDSGEYLYVGHATTPFVSIYHRVGDTFTKITDPVSLPPSTGLSVAPHPPPF
jgi:6-phosphogluconolactonase (cycloisomerase 2 family)